MKIYFSGSISGGRRLEHVYADIVDHLERRGHHVLSLHVASSKLLSRQGKPSAHEIYTRDIGWLKECDKFIAEVSVPSLGVGYEICYALQLGKHVLCLYDETMDISKMILGITEQNIQVTSYQDANSLQLVVDQFIDTTGLEKD